MYRQKLAGGEQVYSQYSNNNYVFKDKYDDIVPCTLNSISRGEKTKNSFTNSTAVDYSSSTNILILVYFVYTR